MSEYVEYRRALRELERREKAARLEVEKAKIAEAPVHVTWLSRYHVRLRWGRRSADYWPSTGKWRRGKRGRAEPGELEDVVAWVRGEDG